MSRTRWLAAVLAVVVSVATFTGRLRAEPAATPRLDWLFDGDVAATVRVGDVVYVGGTFRSVSPVSGALGNFFQLSPSSGAPLPGLPIVNGDISLVSPDGAGGYFLFGQFTNLGGSNGGNAVTGRFQMAHVRADGTDDHAFGAPAISGAATSMVRVGPSLVLGGGFRVNGVGRSLLALDPATGAVTPWVADLPPLFSSEPTVPATVAANGVLYAIFIDNPGLGRRVAAIDGTTGATLWTSEVVGRTGLLPGGLIAVVGNRVIVNVERLYSLDAATGAIDPTWGAAGTTGVSTMTASGNTLVVAGTFTTLLGQPRAGLGAIDIATGQVTAWHPAALPFVQAPLTLVPSASGGAFVAGVLCDPGFVRCRNAIVEVDAAGTTTGWAPQVTLGLNVRAMQLAPNGALVVATQQTSLTGTVARGALAAFDATTGALLPALPAVDGILPGAFATAVDGLVATATTLYLSGTFATVNGVSRAGIAAFDTTSATVLPWAPSAPAAVVFALGTHVYTASRSTNSAWSLRRLDAVSGLADGSWQPPPVIDAVIDHGRIVAVRDAGLPTVGGAAIGELDLGTGAFSGWAQTAALSFASPAEPRAFGGRLAVDGDTIHVAGPRPGIDQYAQRDMAETVVAIDRATGLAVGPSIRGYINGVTMADGRAIVSGGRIVVNGAETLELAEIARPGNITPWRPGWPLFGAPVSFELMGAFNYLRGALGSVVAGDVLIVRGLATGDPGRYRVTGYPLSGPAVPSRLRSQIVGATTVFSWDGMAVPPAGGYVVEGGFASGQTAAALPVGGATSVALVMPAGPLFIRVRAQGSTETSNEVVAGCIAPPLPPTALTATINGSALTLAWTAPAAAVTTYTLLAGSSTGASDAAALALPGTHTSITGAVPGGTFFARVTAANSCGTSGPSGEVFFTMGAPDPLPAAPTSLVASVSGQTVSLSWNGQAAPVTDYVVEAGTGAGLANLGTIRVGPAPSVVLPGVPAGAYAVRVRAVTSAGSGAPSADVIVVVP